MSGWKQQKVDERMKLTWILFIVFLVWHYCALGHEKDLTIIRTIGPQSENDTAHLYFTNLIQLALNKSAKKYGASQLVLSSTTLNQGRWMRMLEQNVYLDVAWGGASHTREDSLIAIPIDLLGGILGVRAMIIRREDRVKFNNIKTLDMLKGLTACQAEHWPDTDILENAGLNVLKTIIFETNFRMLEKGRCDYFPRGFHEGLAEIEQRKDLYTNLVLYESILLYYPFTVYAFVSKKHPEVATRLQKGLEIMMTDGSLTRHMASHPLTTQVFPLQQWRNKVVIRLNNPEINFENLQHKGYWLTPADDEFVFKQAKN